MKTKKNYILDKQQRAFCEGTVEEINGDWIFFDHETDEATPLEHFFFKEIHLLRKKGWKTGILTDGLFVQCEDGQLELLQNDQVKIRKTLTHTFHLFLQELELETFSKFTSELNRLQFSLYDYIYCHNQLSYQLSSSKSGVNFLIFDNSEQICSVHHHFHYDEIKEDRFEFTLSTGERNILQAIIPPTV